METEGVDTWTDEPRSYSKICPDRCVEELVFCGWACYIKIPGQSVGEHVGIADQEKAFRFLRGDPLEEIGLLKVKGVSRGTE